MTITFNRLPDNELPLPSYATSGSAALDLSACLTRLKRQNLCGDTICPIKLSPGEIVLIPTGYKVSFKNAVLKIFIRSSLSLKGLTLANNVGIIDSDYRGELFIAMKNESKYSLFIDHGQRIAQAILEPLVQCEIAEGTVDVTIRGEGGFGSTGH